MHGGLEGTGAMVWLALSDVGMRSHASAVEFRFLAVVWGR